MTTTQNLIAYGSFTSDGNPRTIEIPSGVDYIMVENYSTWGTAPSAVVKSWWQRGMANGSAHELTEGVASALTATAITTNGFTEITPQTGIGAAVAITAITNASPMVASTATTPAVGDIVRVYNTTAAFQYAGMDFSVTAVNPGVSMSFGYTTAPGSAATAGTYRRLPFDLQYYPRKRYITGITAGATTVIQLSVTHGYVVGQKVSIRVPAGWGMVELNGQTGNITAINTATNTLTVDINSAAYTAFAWPTSATAAAGISFPHIVPAGEITILTGAFKDEGYIGMYLGSGVVGANTNVMRWIAYKGEAI